ncbi:Oxidoreductase, FAD-binding protein [Croceitalea dokdonensis DOKDO 023]|uniref:Oxidoreductase, FAD-binding protein n=1 Tax=Croceitalea dokdonensis DOKDO 023 TaxID=1300341 RepID=A0A0P7AT23_9FLAO|nr:FAD-dependent oxidoreductase [Croceitalea dokdonensis]KPM31111.1 Oxidoreductase, FAD-binding protein [Croceitalea dokdonensis DOKDO 023]
MDKKDYKIYIIGAGVSGLVAAKTLKEHGFLPVLLEATQSPGGRVKTDTADGVQFDHGFQVLLTDYPQAKKHLDYKALELHYFKPGALIFKDGTTQRIGDPLRDPSSFWPTVKATIGSVKDKFKIYALTRQLKAKSISTIFSDTETTTLAYLKAYGFSDVIIANFFKPFFTGIFLEDTLKTSSRLFEFVFKMFGEGYAALPANGIGAIPAQLAKTVGPLEFETEVSQVHAHKIAIKNGATVEAHAVISTLPVDEKGNIRTQQVTWKSCDNLYFTVHNRTFEEGIIGLVAHKDTFTNNLYYPFGQTFNGDPVLSVTVVKNHEKTQEELIKTVMEELRQHCQIQVKSFLRAYPIKQALPDITNLGMQPNPNSIRNEQGVYLAGDHLLSGSLNAAMASGEAAAEAVVRDFVQD